MNKSQTQSVLRSMNQCSSPVAKRFFSGANIDSIQNRLIQIVKQRSGFLISPQPIDSLTVIMRSVYVLNARNSACEAIDAQVRTLNDAVMGEIVPQVLTSMQAHIGYLRDTQGPLVPLDRGTNTSIRGTQSVGFFS